MKCLDVNQQKRLTIAELAETPYFQNLLKFDVIPLGGRKNNILAISSGQFSTKAMTPNHNSGNLPLSRHGNDEASYSLEKNKIGLNNKVFYNTFQNQRIQDLSPKLSHSPTPTSNLMSPLNPVRNSYQNLRPSSSSTDKLNMGFNNVNLQSNDNGNRYTNGYSHSQLRGQTSPLSTSFKNIGRPPSRQIYSQIVKPRAQSFYGVRAGLGVVSMRQCLPGLLSFKQAVNCLHYCRLIYKYVLLVKDIEDKDHNLVGLMFKMLEQINFKIEKKEIAYDHETSKKESKLREVSSEYIRKYSLQFSREIPQEVKYLQILALLKQKLVKYEGLHKKNMTYLQGMHFILTIIEATQVLRRCAGSGKYWEWSQYKVVEEFLASGKDKMSYEGYLERRRTVVG